jgi:tetratricopeptide (TPR) repeat protein
MALVVKATSRIHTNLGGGLLGAKRGGEAAGAALGVRRDGMLVLDPKSKRKKKDKEINVADASKERKDPKKKRLKMTELDAKKIWQEALDKGVNDPALIIACTDFLAQAQKFEHTAEFLKANLRQGIVTRPWVYEALAVALESSGGSPQEILRAKLSAVDLEPQDAPNFLKAAKAMAESKQWKRALAFSQKAADLQPNAPYTYADALVYADKAKDPKGMEWAAGNLLKQDWPVDNTHFQRQAQAKLEAMVRVLKKTKQAGAAERLVRSVNRLKERDLVIHLSWAAGESGAADLDLEVKEPTGSTCSCLQRLTPGGGLLIGDTLSQLNRESYIASEGFSGEYTVKIRRIWGRPLGGKAKLVIIKHQGTPEETRAEKVIRFDREHTLTVKLEKGRRTSTAVIPPDEAYKRPEDNKEDLAKPSEVMTKLHNLADPEFSGAGAPRTWGSSGGSSPASRVPPGRKQPEQVATQARVSPFFTNSFDLTAQAVVSADRRYVRLSVSPFFRVVTPSTTAVFSVPLIPGAP